MSEPRRFFVRTFGCQMNEHDSERIAGLLQADGLEETDQRRGRRRRRPQHLLHPGERRQQALRHPRPPQVAEGPQAGHADRRGRLPGPEGPRHRHRPGAATSTWCSAPTTCTGPPSCSTRPRPPGTRSSRSSRRPWPTTSTPSRRRCPVRREVPWAGLGHDPDRLRQQLRVLHRARRARQGDQPALRRHRRRGAPRRRRRRHRGHAARPEREQLRPRPHPRGPPGRRRRARSGRCSTSSCARSARVDGIERVRYTSPHPKDLRPETIAAMAETPAVCEHLHLPLQSGSDRVLAAMHRGYTAERYLERLAAARAAIDDLAVTTDIIVGFPGETDDDFERTLEVAAEAAYDSAYTFIYSPRPGTEAAERVDEFVPADVVAERFERLRDRRRALRPGQARGPRRARRGGARGGPVPQGPRRPHRPHPPEQARPLRRPRRSGRAATPPCGSRGAAPHHLRGELVEVTEPGRAQDAPAPARRLITITEEPYDGPVAAGLVQELLVGAQRALRRRRARPGSADAPDDDDYLAEVTPELVRPPEGRRSSSRGSTATRSAAAR